MHALHHRRQQVLRHGEDDCDGLKLRDDHEAIGVARAHDVARINQTQPEAAADRRADARIGELQPRVFHLARVHAERAFVLAYQRGLRVDLLLGDRILLEKRLIALEVEARVFEERSVARELSFRLLQLDLEGPRIDLGQELALSYDLAFLEHRVAAVPDPHAVLQPVVDVLLRL